MAGSVQLTMEVLCDGLDQLCIKQLELMDQLIKANMMLEECMRGGFFMLGKTRYSLGTHAVSALQLPSSDCEVGRLAEVISEPVSLESYRDDIMYHRIDARFGDPAMQVADSDGNTEDSKDCDSSSQHVSLDDNSHPGLRKRSSVKSKQHVEEVSPSEDVAVKSGNTSADNEKNTAKVVSGNPIRWFTALPPQTLRQAQTEFKTAVSLVAECATTQLKLRAVNKEFRRLQEIKSKLDSVEKEA